MLKKLIITIILPLLFLGGISSQKASYAVHISNPLGLLYKFGGKIEYKTNHHGYLFCLTQYLDDYIALYPGTQVGLEWRSYSEELSKKGNEKFFYAKLISGHQNYRPQTGSGFTNVKEIPEGYYYGFGIGAGRHYNYKHFFMEFNGGLKGVYSTTKQLAAFYIVGPASIVDLHFNIGYQFYE